MGDNTQSTRPRLPNLSDLPEPLTGIIISSITPITNCLILLHGLGGSHEPFAQLAKHLNLPETVCISLRGLKAVPLVDFCDDQAGSWHWGADITFDKNGAVSDDADLQESKEALSALFKVLITPQPAGCGFRSQAIFLMGFGQGGRLALQVALEKGQSVLSYEDSEYYHHYNSSFNCHLGGVLSIGGIIEPIHGFNEIHKIRKIPTSILICGGDNDTSCITSKVIQYLSHFFYDVQHIIWEDHDGDSMPRNPREWYPLIQWFSQKLLLHF
ncbi:hypothetical protein PCANB_002484 [Pneumocystis canis]|nr:hypothetical protein PCK1_002513 [Pneumocystis canis]KAG5438764.1 hypothetical protein PCANB_002484 [Pneumocystis canis]